MDEKPPSTVNSDPVINEELSEAKSNIGAINSSTLPNLPKGVWFKIAFFLLLSIKFFKFHFVGKKPGLIQLTLTPYCAHSLAKFCVKFLTPALAIEYGNALDKGGPAEADEKFIILPDPLEIISFPKYLHDRKVVFI